MNFLVRKFPGISPEVLVLGHFFFLVGLPRGASLSHGDGFAGLRHTPSHARPGSRLVGLALGWLPASWLRLGSLVLGFGLISA